AGLSAATSSSMSSGRAGPPSSREGRSPRIIVTVSLRVYCATRLRPPAAPDNDHLPRRQMLSVHSASGSRMQSHRIAIMTSPTAALRDGVLLPPASTSRRWWARILDTVFILMFTGFIIAIAFALYGVDVISIDAAVGVALITYPLMVLLFGALYGCTVSPGQALCGVMSLQTGH